MLPIGKRKFAATLVHTLLAYTVGTCLLCLDKISGSEFVSLLYGAGGVVIAFLGANAVAAKWSKK